VILTRLAEKFREHLDANDVRGEKAVLYERDLEPFSGGEIVALMKMDYLKQVDAGKWLTGEACDKKRNLRFVWIVRSHCVDVPDGFDEGSAWDNEEAAERDAFRAQESWMAIAEAAKWKPKKGGRYEVYIFRNTATEKMPAFQGIWAHVTIDKLPLYSDDEDYLRAAHTT
jgi:hypothetical protein